MSTQNFIVFGTTAFGILNIHCGKDGQTYYLDRKGIKDWEPKSKFVKIAVPDGFCNKVEGEIISIRFGRMETSCRLKEARN